MGFQFEISDLKMVDFDAGWSSPVARWAHNPKVAGSNPAPATKLIADFQLPIANLSFTTLEIGNRRLPIGNASGV